jgi:hypothetical protein
VFCLGDRLSKLLPYIRDITDVGIVNKSDIQDDSKDPQMTILGPFKMIIGDDKHLRLYSSQGIENDQPNRRDP